MGLKFMSRKINNNRAELLEKSHIATTVNHLFNIWSSSMTNFTASFTVRG